MNMIPYNTVEGLDFQRPDPGRAAAIAKSLLQRRILTKLRQSAGQEIDGGCGQLRARAGGAVQPLTFTRRAPASTTPST